MTDTRVLHLAQGGAPGQRYMFFCPGCQCGHWFQVGEGPGPRWDFNGDLVRPTVTPSILTDFGGDPEPMRCHSYVTDGQIQFLGDCTHALAGQTVPLEPF